VSSFIPQCLSAADEADEEFPFTETLAARKRGATAVHRDHAQSGGVLRTSVRYLREAAKIAQNQAF
jgi:hypothetical protein